MTPRRVRYSKIERFVDAILHEHGVLKPAVPINDIIRSAGIQLLGGDLGDVSGLLARKPDQTIIGVNSKQSPLRQRFTMAHEYGHYLLHDGIASHSDTNFRVNFRNRTSSEASDIDEMEANFFAASILMPKKFLDEMRAYEAIDDDDHVARIAATFRVSPHAMSLRLANVYRTHSPY